MIPIAPCRLPLALRHSRRRQPAAARPTAGPDVAAYADPNPRANPPQAPTPWLPTKGQPMGGSAGRGGWRHHAVQPVGGGRQQKLPGSCPEPGVPCVGGAESQQQQRGCDGQSRTHGVYCGSIASSSRDRSGASGGCARRGATRREGACNRRQGQGRGWGAGAGAGGCRR